MIDPFNDSGFLGRWSRRKRGLEGDAESPLTQAPEREGENGDPARHDIRGGNGAKAAEGEGETLELEGLSDEELLEKLGLKDPDTLARGDDFSGFMRKAVPGHLRRRALHQLWRSNPILANLDGLNDYEQDFSAGSVAAGGLATAYKVGRGLVSHIVDNRSKLSPDIRSDERAGDTATRHDHPAPGVDAGVEGDAVDAPTAQGGTEPVQARVARPRMVFAFENGDGDA